MKYTMFASLLTGLLLLPHSLAATTSYTVKRPMETQQTLTDAYQAKGILYRPRTEHLNPDGSPRYINRLILEDSPYLLQHAHNPVDWHAWGEAAFELAKRENKPIFLSIGYSTCHWCHVMERESFENTAIAKLLNDHFVSIKVDRESHPDVDEVYMTAVMLMTGQGGWPMSSFLTPDGKPFFAGTYFPPQQFASVLNQIVQLWQEHRSDVLEQANRVTEAVEASNNRQGKVKTLDTQILAKAARQILQGYDELLGGFSQAPKFPHEPWLYLLLNLAERTHDQVILDALEVTLDAMARGGIYDQVGGGFHRYSTDPDWLVPHFEKMLYNQAHLARVYLQAWRLTDKEKYRRVVTQTLDYVAREMTAPDGGFYSATDADSEGEEGAFFIWTPEQIKRALTPEDAALAIKLYSITQRGNFEGRNILHLSQSLESFAEREKMAIDDLRQRVDQVNATLHATRESREHPLRDDKIVTAWNGMMISAFAQAADLLSSSDYRQIAERAGAFLWQHNRRPDGRLWRVHLNGQSSVPATLEDYAYLAEGMLHLYDLNRNIRWLERAQELTSVMQQRFLDQADNRFYMSEAEADITAMSRPKDSGSDNAIPSGTSVAMRVLQMLWQRTGNIDYRLQLDQLISGFASNIEAQPNGYAYMLTAIDDRHHGELTQHAYAAQGGIRVDGSLHSLVEDQQLLRVEIDIPEGWHINANRPNQQDLIPTDLKLAAEAADWRLAPVTYPKGSLQTLAFQSEPMAVYEKQVQLEGLVERISSTDKSLTLPVELSLQACNNEVCLPPERITLWIHQAK